jgi:hypothetical protein
MLARIAAFAAFLAALVTVIVFISGKNSLKQLLDESPAPQAVSTPLSDCREGVFQGTWFTIQYPVSFKCVPMRRTPSMSGFDSARFISPDGEVEFYVYVPRNDWSTDDFTLRSSEKIEEDISRDYNNGQTQFHWVTMAANDGSYRRSYVEENYISRNKKRAFGIKYKDKATYDIYLQLYTTFKESLVENQ